MNKFQSFLTQNLAPMQGVEPADQAKIDGGAAPTWGPKGTLQGDIPHGPILKTGPIVQGPASPTLPPVHG
jgi:hypothetical protein